TLLWIGYPLFWILGPSGVGAISQTVETTLFVVWPILSKVGWSLMDLLSLRALHPVEPATVRTGYARA
nr:bacteriorhodopsin [Gemmatimonadaceae bacterium]